jgi:Alginate export
MANRAVVKLVLVMAAVLLLSGSAYAEMTDTSGLYFRLRQETWDNMFDMNKSDVANANPYARQDENYWRLKTSVWNKLDFDKQYGLFAKITNEARYFMTSNTASQLGLVGDEFLFDNLYAYYKKPAGLPIDLTVGRQDFLGTFGEGFLIMDGTPLDGSRTFYFNAARALVTINDQYNVDFVYLFTQEHDNALPTYSMYTKARYGFEDRALNSYDEKGAVIYGRGKVTENVTIEPYYIWKEEATPDGTTKPALRLNTYGAHAVVGFGQGWKARAEYALQSGEYNDAAKTKREGNGGYAYIGRSYDTIAMKPSWDLGYITMSGDDQSTTNKNEGWDPLWSRYPQISELYSLSLGVTETGIPAYWTNVDIYRAIVRMNPAENTRLELTYNYLKADKTFSAASGPFAPMFSGDSKDRGQLVTAKLSHKFSPAVDGYVLIEQFLPGNFYAKPNQFDAQFVRWELQWKI